MQDTAETGGVHSPVVRSEAVRTLPAYSAVQGRSVLQLDVEGAYTKAPITGKPIYVSPPLKDRSKRGHVLKLHRSLYGLRSSGKAWYETLTKCLRSQGLQSSKADPCLFFNADKTMHIAVFVDDLLAKETLMDNFIRGFERGASLDRESALAVVSAYALDALVDRDSLSEFDELVLTRELGNE